MDDRFEAELARHSAAVLLECKPAALFSSVCETESIFEWKRELRKRGIDIRIMARKRGRLLVMVYQMEMLENALNAHIARTVLSRLGYPMDEGLAALLNKLALRLGVQDEFPHEVGFFLGYPPKDVIGFIRHKGSNCKHCGLWKVYDDVEKAVLLTAAYNSCKVRLQNYIDNGGSLCNLCAKTAG